MNKMGKYLIPATSAGMVLCASTAFGALTLDNNGGSDADEFSSHMDGNDISKAHQAQLAIQSNGYITSSGVNIMV